MTNMKPFAYQVLSLRYGELEINQVFPSLRSAYGFVVINFGPQNEREIFAWLPDSSIVAIPLDDRFRVKNELDEKAIREEARNKINIDAAAQAAFYKEIRGSVTGSPWLCDMGEDYVFDMLVEERQYRWKLESEVDWADIESSLLEKE